MRALFCLGLFGLIAPIAQSAERPPTCRSAPPVGSPHGVPADLTSSLPVADYLDGAFDCTSPKNPSVAALQKPSSAWSTDLSRRYSEMLARTPSDWLLLPVQTQYFGFDFAERTLVTAELADAFASVGAFPDPMLVERALGDGQRRFDPAAIQRLTKSLHAKRRIDGYLGHDGKGRLTLTIQLMDCNDSAGCKLVKQHDWRGIAFTADTPAFLAVRALKADLRAQLAFPAPVSRPVTGAPSPATTAIGITPNALATRRFHGDPAVISGLLATLAPGDGTPQRDRLNVLALRDAMNGGAVSLDRFLAANAAFNLQRRPYAIKLLEGMADPASKTLRALLDGNLNEAKASFSSITEPLPRLILAFEIEDLRINYDRKGKFNDSAVKKVFGAVAPQWQTLVTRRVSEADFWGATNSRTLDQLLTSTFPVTHTGTKSPPASISRVEVNSGEAPAASSLRHLQDALAHLHANDCCDKPARKFSWQLDWLFEATAETDVSKDLNRLIEL
jgi:hypothetical protein